jgi:hypothetical protein
MRLPKPTEWTGLASLLLGGLIYIKAKKKTVAILLVATGLGFVVFSLVSSESERKTAENHGQNATATGPGATAINAASGAIVSVSSGATIEQIKEAMRQVQREQGPDLRKLFTLGYVLFTATETQEIIPLNRPIDTGLEVDWESGHSVSLTSNSVTLYLPQVVIRTQLTILQLGPGPYTISRKIEPLENSIIYEEANVRVALKVVSTNEDSVMVALGIESKPAK